MCLFFKQKTAYEVRSSDWSSDGCSSDLGLDDPTAPPLVRLEKKAALEFLVEEPVEHRCSLVVADPAIVGIAEHQWKPFPAERKIGRALRRERVCHFVSISVVASSFKYKPLNLHTFTLTIIL